MLFFVFRLQEIIIRFIVVIQAFGGNSPDFVFVIFKQMGYIVVEVFFQFVSVKTSYAGACTYPHISFSWLTVRHRTEEDKPFWILMICWKAYCFISVALKGRDNNRQIIKKTGFFFIRIVQGVAAKVVYCFGNTKYCAKYPV